MKVAKLIKVKDRTIFRKVFDPDGNISAEEFLRTFYAELAKRCPDLSLDGPDTIEIWEPASGDVERT